MFSGLSSIMPYLVPVLVIHAAMVVLAIMDVLQRKKVAGDRKWPWIIAIIIMVILGPVIYFFVGRVVEDVHNAES